MEDTTLELGMKIPIQEPCHENWDSMCGSDQKRFCDSCDKNVHNLSEMTENQARDLLKEEESLCIRYRTHRSGHIRFRKALPLIALLSVGCDYVPPAESTDSFSVKIKKNVMRGSAHFLNRMFSPVEGPETKDGWVETQFRKTANRISDASEEILYLPTPYYIMGVM